MATKLKNKCTVTLRQDDFGTIKTYRINDRLFYMLEKSLEKFRSISPQPRKIRCVETGEIFESARKASKWVESALKIDYCDFNLLKAACKRQNGKSYGYHWEFASWDAGIWKRGYAPELTGA